MYEWDSNLEAVSIWNVHDGYMGIMPHGGISLALLRHKAM